MENAMNQVLESYKLRQGNFPVISVKLYEPVRLDIPVRKRGRPPKMDDSSSSSADEVVKRMRGRPPKKRNNDCVVVRLEDEKDNVIVKRKRGRPRKKRDDAAKEPQKKRHEDDAAKEEFIMKDTDKRVVVSAFHNFRCPAVIVAENRGRERDTSFDRKNVKPCGFCFQKNN